MLTRVVIRSDQTDKDCEALINQTIADNPDKNVEFELLIENTYSVINSIHQTTYTLLIRIEDAEDDEE